MRAKITKRLVDTAEAQGKRLFIFDTEVKGFGLSVTTRGSKSYILDYRPAPGGRATPKRRLTIGTHGSPWSPELARREAIRLLGLVSAGRDPAAEKAAARSKSVDGATVAAAVDQFIERYARPHQRTWKITERILKRELVAEFGKRQLESVTRAEIIATIDRVADRGPVMAGQVLTLTRRFFNWCAERGLIEHSPVNRIPSPGKATDRERVLTPEELSSIWTAAGKLQRPSIGPITRLLMLTGQRRMEVAGILGSELAEVAWSEIGFTGPVWSLAGERTKNKRPHTIPLTTMAWEIIAPLRDERGSGLLFPVVGRDRERRPFSAWSRAKNELDDESGVKDWRFHDIRRSVDTGLAQLGFEPHIGERILNHAAGQISGVAATYNRHRYILEMANALNAWEAHLKHLVTGQTAPATNVVAIRDGTAGG